MKHRLCSHTHLYLIDPVVHFAQAVTWYYGYLDLKAFPAFQKVQSFFYRWKETLAKVVQTKHL